MSKSKPRHGFQFLIPDIDTSAQYYHKPESRLKDQIFLASSQKFDEAVEFGFPTSKNGSKTPNSSELESDIGIQGIKATFPKTPTTLIMRQYAAMRRTHPRNTPPLSRGRTSLRLS
ncbi:hypothetical protein BDV11DRAFT_76611 [Aspergillus similis]